MKTNFRKKKYPTAAHLIKNVRVALFCRLLKAAKQVQKVQGRTGQGRAAYG